MSAKIKKFLVVGGRVLAKSFAWLLERFGTFAFFIAQKLRSVSSDAGT